MKRKALLVFVAVIAGPPVYIAAWLLLFKSWGFIFNALSGLIHS